MIDNLLIRWTTWVTGHAWQLLVIIGLATLGAAWFAITEFSMNSDTSRLIRQDTDWRRTHDKFIETFPQYDRSTLVVVSGKQPNQVSRVAQALATELGKEESVFQSVYSPASGAFADANALLYLDVERLSNAVSRLAEAQPFLAAIAGDESLRSALLLIRDALESDADLSAGFVQINDALALAAERAVKGQDKPISWRDQLFQPEADKVWYQVIFVQGLQNTEQELPNARIVQTLETTIEKLDHPWKEDVQIRMTGQVPLEHGEILSAMNSARMTGTLALFILAGLLIWGVRSGRIVAATYLSMLVGLIWTAAFAMVAVGEYNTLSIIFLVMFIGLGVDFAIHLCLKYQEARMHEGKQLALIETGGELGQTIALCGITSALGFLAFVPTDYIGLAEMGIISGGGMIIAVLISLTLIPAFFALVKAPGPARNLPFVDAMTFITVKHPHVTAWGTLALAVLSGIVATQARFDYSTLSLKNPESEAMTTLRELHEEDIITDYVLTWMAPDMETARRFKPQLLEQSLVSLVRLPDDYLPADQKESLAILDEASFFLESIFAPADETSALPDAEFVSLLGELEASLGQRLLEADTSPEMTASLQSLKTSLAALQTEKPAARNLFTSLVLPPIKAETEWLSRALTPEELTLDDLPDAMRSRFIAPNGQTLVSITPAEDLLPVDTLRRFTEAVMSLVPVTGRPVLDLGIGSIVIKAFSTALALAVISIFIVLMLTLRNFLDSLLVFIPLAMTALLTLSVSVLANLPLNMANVVVIPLIFGLGVGNGIHVVRRFHQCSNVDELVHSSTPRAVFLSNLTTLGTFGALSFSTHQGIWSIGVLLTVALSSLMLLTLISLPALLATFSSPRGPEEAHESNS